ncbi:MAG: nickel pincer cofactor biosynthesis protein LarB [Planctomycetota bacterium]|jgi:NCAIR mutase (PurE)-related protein
MMTDTSKTTASTAAIACFIEQFQRGEITSLEFGQHILRASIASDGNVTPDVERLTRTGYPEVIYGAGKSPESILKAANALLQTTREVLVTRISPEQVRTVTDHFSWTRWNHVARTLRIGRESQPLEPGQVVSDHHAGIVTAGTTDEPVAMEAQETLAWMGQASSLIQDVGVAGPYRLLSRVPELRRCAVVVCVAGMEAALPSALAGHVACPVVAVPTSVGYGANLGGIAALLSMLNSCAANVTVVNIDAGFKGGYIAGLIARGPSAVACS